MAYRAFVTVHEEAWRNSQAILKELGISPAIYNSLLNAYVEKQYENLKILQKKKASGEPVSWLEFLKINGILLDDGQIEIPS